MVPMVWTAHAPFTMTEDQHHDHPGPPVPQQPRDRWTRAAGRARVGTSVGVVVADRDPREAAALVADVQDSLPPATRQEFLVLDDHTNPRRRALISALEGTGDAMRLVPRPAGGISVELDALAASCGSEFLLVVAGDAPPLAGVEALLGRMWSGGADAGAVLSGERAGPGDTAARFTSYLGLGAPDTRPDGARVVLVRRWVARWVFSETERALDPGREVADRARLLGLEMVVVDRLGAPVA